MLAGLESGFFNNHSIAAGLSDSHSKPFSLLDEKGICR